ncbi:uncharacterized protein [Henckelia pumila]|uniref:uncharacterized protein n=1 Tax=Henckelia pumila TaxID=405737 RepID=UPI003C6DF6E0
MTGGLCPKELAGQERLFSASRHRFTNPSYDVGEDPHKHLMEFHVVCTSMKPHGATGEKIQMRAFLFSLKNAAKDWLYYLPPGSITTWTEMKRIFLEKSMLDAAIGGVFVDKTLVQAMNLIENMTSNSQQFGTNTSNGKNVKKCGICAAMGHGSDMCPILQEESTEQVNAAGGFPWPPQQKYDPYSNTFNPAYRPPYHPQQQRPQIPAPGEFLENIVKDLATNTVTFQQKKGASIQQLNTQMGQLATTVNMLEALNSSSLPSQTVVNPKENVSAFTLMSGRELKVHEEEVQTPLKKEEV